MRPVIRPSFLAGKVGGAVYHHGGDKMKVWFLARGLAVAAAILALCPAYSSARDDSDFREPLVIGHRGAHGYLPAHTLEGYASPSNWAPTSSSPTWWRPGTATSSPATSPTSRQPLTWRASRTSPRAGAPS